MIPQGSILVPLLFLLYVNNLKYASDIWTYVYCNSLCSSLWRHKFEIYLSLLIKPFSYSKKCVQMKQGTFIIFKGFSLKQIKPTIFGWEPFKKYVLSKFINFRPSSLLVQFDTPLIPFSPLVHFDTLAWAYALFKPSHPSAKTSELDLKVFCSNSVQIFSGIYFFQLKEIIVKLHLNIAFLEVDI